MESRRTSSETRIQRELLLAFVTLYAPLPEEVPGPITSVI
jgi:hypothetical protein